MPSTHSNAPADAKPQQPAATAPKDPNDVSAARAARAAAPVTANKNYAR